MLWGEEGYKLGLIGIYAGGTPQQGISGVREWGGYFQKMGLYEETSARFWPGKGKKIFCGCKKGGEG